MFLQAASLRRHERIYNLMHQIHTSITLLMVHRYISYKKFIFWDFYRSFPKYIKPTSLSLRHQHRLLCHHKVVTIGNLQHNDDENVQLLILSMMIGIGGGGNVLSLYSDILLSFKDHHIYNICTLSGLVEVKAEVRSRCSSW